MKKQQIISLIIVGLFMTSFVLGSNFSTQSTDHEPFPNETVPSAIEPTDPIITAPDSSDWFSGETVNTDIEFNKQTFHVNEISMDINPLIDIYSTMWMNMHYIWADDVSDAYFKIIYDTPLATSTSVSMYAYIYCGGAGVFTYNVETHVEDSDGDDIYSGEGDGTLAVTADMLDSEGYLFFWLWAVGHPLTTLFDLAYIPSGGDRVWIANEVNAGIIDDVKNFFLLIDAFYFTRSTIENQIRSEYQYASDTMLIHSLTIPSVPHAKEINVYAPTHWTYSSTNPTATVTESSSDYTIASPTELTYEMIFTSNSTYLLAIEETTITYISLTEANFEGGTKGGWFDYRVYLELAGMDTFEVSTDISQEGYHSLHIQTSTDGYPTASLAFDETSDVNLAEGFYFSFWYYWVTTDTFRLSIRNDLDSDWKSYTLPTTVTNRWIRYCAFFDGTCITSGVKSIEFYGADASSTMEIYLDNFEIFTVSTTIDTIDLDEYEITSEFIVWDGYQNVPAINKEVELKGYYRNYAYEPANTWDTYSFLEETVITNSDGIATTTLSATLEQKECVILAYSEDSGFSENLNTRLDLFAGSSGVQSITENDQGEIEIVGKIGYYSGAYRFIFAYDFSDMYVNEFTIFTITSKFNDTVGLSNQEARQNFDPSPYHREYVTKDTDYTTDFASYGFWGTWNTINTNGVIDQEYMSSYMLMAIGFHFYSSVTYLNKFYLYTISNINVLQAQAFMFTPSYPYNLDYAETEITDEWDFSEGDDENWDAYDVLTIQNGYAYDEDATPRYANTFDEFDGSVADLTDCDKIIMRYKTNISDWYLKSSAGYDYNFDLNGDENWNIIDYDIITLYKTSHTQIEFRSVNPAYIYIDFIRIVHVEEPETYLTNTYLGFGSENDKWISAVYSDDIFLGYYNDPNIVYLNQTIGTHNISRLPVARQGETKAFLYSDLHTYTYQVSEPNNYFLLLNPPSYDISAGLIYIDVVSFWGNQTVRVWMNETWLGDAVSEGSSVWSCDFSSAGYYNFTVFVYNGAEVWTTLTSSITIPSVEEESLQLLFLTKDVDTSVSQVFVNYYTNWENTSLIVFDNSTQLGTELSGEGASIWSFSQVEYYAFHNITINIYHDSVLQFVYYFSFTIQAPALEPNNYFILLNPPSYDIDAGLIYIDLVTYYGNCTYQVKMNESSLGDAISEGSSVWSCDFSSAGYYNFTVYVYQGATIWSTLTSSITIAEPIPAEELTLLFLTKDVDTSVSQVFVNYYSNWGNTTLIVFDNSTQLGTELSGEGASIWSFSQVEYYAFHNITINIYHDSVLQFVYYFSFTIQAPMLPDNYFILLTPPSYDISAGLVYLDIVTYYGNCTYQVMMNESFLGEAIGEGSSVWTFDSSSAGFYNFTVFIYQGATTWSVLSSSITIPEPTPVEELTLLFLTKDADIPAKLIFVNYYSNWENTTCRVFDNEQMLGSYCGEGASIWDFSSIDYYGYHNITIEIYHATIIQFTVTFGFTVQKPATTIHTVHYDLVTLEGVGLSFETAKIYMNGSRIYASEQYYLSNSILLIEVKDYYNNLLYNTTIQVTDNLDISLPLNLIQQQIENNYDVAVEVYFFSTTDSNSNHSYIIASHSSIVILLFTNSYNIIVNPLSNEFNNGTHIITYFATSATYQDLGYEPEVYQVTMETDVETLYEEEGSTLSDQTKSILGVTILSIVINSVLIAFIGSMGKWGLVKVWNWVMFIPNTIINAICHLWGGKGVNILVENKGGLEFINPEQYKIIEQSKKEGKM